MPKVSKSGICGIDSYLVCLTLLRGGLQICCSVRRTELLMIHREPSNRTLRLLGKNRKFQKERNRGVLGMNNI